jgi:hypothetical protein
MEPSNNTDATPACGGRLDADGYCEVCAPQPVPAAAYAHETIALLNHVEAVEDEIGALIGDTERSRNAQISDRHREVGTTLKLADIYSQLAIAEAIDKVRVQIRDNALATVSLPAVINYADGDPHR